MDGANPAHVMEQAGTALRTMVNQLRETASDRSAIKYEFRILATQVRPDDNNPIRFSPDGETALRSLLCGKRAASGVVQEVMEQSRLHELAMISAMREAVDELLQQLSPDRLRTTEQGVLQVQRKARAYERYEALHAGIVRALSDDFDSVFGKAFARAYERVALGDPERRRR